MLGYVRATSGLRPSWNAEAIDTTEPPAWTRPPPPIWIMIFGVGDFGKMRKRTHDSAGGKGWEFWRDEEKKRRREEKKKRRRRRRRRKEKKRRDEEKKRKLWPNLANFKVLTCTKVIKTWSKRNHFGQFCNIITWLATLLPFLVDYRTFWYIIPFWCYIIATLLNIEPAIPRKGLHYSKLVLHYPNALTLSKN